MRPVRVSFLAAFDVQTEAGGSRAAAVAPAAKSHRLSSVCANGSLQLPRSSSERSTVTCVAACACSCWAKAMAGPNARILTAAARATALCRVRTGLDRPGDRCNLIAFAGYAEDVARDAGDVSACLELNFVRAAGNAW